LKCLDFYHVTDEVFCDDLAAALPSNSTLQELVLRMPGGQCAWLSPLFLALQVNTGLKKLQIDVSARKIGQGRTLRLNIEASLTRIDEKLCTAMRLGLGSNSTLEFLELSNIKTGGNDTSLWREAFSFLRTNATLKTLRMRFEDNVTKSHATAIRMEVLAALHDNKSLETLSMPIVFILGSRNISSVLLRSSQIQR
jgi:hypothetical protein